MAQRNIVIGTASGHDLNLTLSWTCPITGIPVFCQGEFAYDEDGYWHDVFDTNDEYLYTVIANVPDKVA